MSRSSLHIFQTLFTLLLFLAHGESLFFNFTHFDKNTQNVSLWNDSTTANGAIVLTNGDIYNSVGRASYSHPVRLWDKNTKKNASFTTHFSFNITPAEKTVYYGDGFAFFLAPFDDSAAYAPGNSSGGRLGLLGREDTKYPFVAVEFDTYQNSFDPNHDHLGIDVSSVVSRDTVPVSGDMKNRTTANAWITYDSSNKNLSVYLSYDAHPVFNGEYNLSHVIDLSSTLPEKVRVGFSSATGLNIELHNIFSWDFNSTLEDTDISVPAPLQNHTGNQPPTVTSPSNSKAALVGGLVAGISVLIIGLGSVAFMWWRRRSRGKDDINFDMDNDFDQDTGPKRFTYNELIRATSNFPEERKLGQGGFGSVYRGYLSNLSRDIAVKKISNGSKQGKKEYVSEVKIISRLRHKNLVQLLGWCHERGDLLLVYEFMPNGSLDSHLYAGKRKVLPWAVRYKVAQDLASALLYLHQDWEQCVLHRDIKPSNVMLDSDFNAKLGDFGLARLVDHNLGAQTTSVAGTLGYLAPDCVITGQATKESDVYSFGVVALEIARGRRPVETRDEVSMLEWVWNLYGEGRLLEEVDKRLEGEFDIQQVERLMIVGLWCCHPDHTCRPSIKQAINVLNLELPLPCLPLKFPVPIYFSALPNGTFFITSSSSRIISNSNTLNSSSQPVGSDAAASFSES